MIYIKIIETELKDCYIIEPVIHGDNRGYFMETHNEKELENFNLHYHFIQSNESFTAKKGTLRGMHYQKDPMSQAKLVRCLKGEIYDVVVDLRSDSKTYKKWIKVKLTEENKLQLLIPRGFAHGFITLTDNVIFSYLVDNFYSKEHEEGFIWNDSEINIDWEEKHPILNERDNSQPTFSELNPNFKCK